jgi:hypothetical protein
MHFEVNGRPAELPAFLNVLTQISGAAAWQKREKDFLRQLQENPLIERYLDTQFGIERSMIFVHHYRRNTGGRVPSVVHTPRTDLAVLYSFAAMVARIFPRLPAPAQNTLRGRIQAGLKDNVGLAPLAFEMRTAAHFMARGFDVEFHDLCDGGGYDFLVKNSEIEMEVECKSVSSDLGHRVHLLRQYQLGSYLLQSMKKASKDGMVQLLVATLPDRLHSEREFMKAVGARIAEALMGAKDMTSKLPCSVSYHEFSIAGSPFDCDSPPQISEDDVLGYCNQALGDDTGHLIMMFKPRQSATVVALRSALPNEFLKGVYRNLKEAASRQLSGTKPGIICVQFRSLTSRQLREVAENPSQSGKPTGIQLMTAKFFDSDARAHVHTLAYVAPGEFVRRRSQTLDTHSTDMIRTTAISEDAESYVFSNKKHPHVNDQRYRAFT